MLNLDQPKPRHLKRHDSRWDDVLESAAAELEEESVSARREEPDQASSHGGEPRQDTAPTIDDAEERHKSRKARQHYAEELLSEHGEALYPDAGEDLPVGVSDNPLKMRLNADIARLLAQDTALARDVAYFGEDRLDEIIEGYELTPEALYEKLQDDRFRSMVHKFRMDIDKDRHGLVRARAATYLDAELDRVHGIAMSAEKDTDSLKAVNFMASLADALPKKNEGIEGSNGSGVAIAINIGQDHPLQGKFKEIVVGDDDQDVEKTGGGQ